MSKQSKEQCDETIETQIPRDFEHVVRDFEILTTCNLANVYTFIMFIWAAFKRANTQKIQIIHENTRIEYIENRNSTRSDI
jgi:hypothetical protein